MSEKPTKHTKVLIIGSGPAGYTAAVYAARAMLKPILVYGSEPGGQLTTTTDVENYPGFAKAIQGPWLMEQMKEQAHAVGTEMIEDHISSVNLKSKPFEAIGDGGQKYTADSIIISTGAQARWLNLKSEQNYRGFGVSACATCDGFFFKDKQVAVVGGGNAAVEGAILIAKYAKKVFLVYRGEKLWRPEPILLETLNKTENVDVLLNNNVIELIGSDFGGLQKIKFEKEHNNETEYTVDGLMIEAGADPRIEIPNSLGIDLDIETNEVVVDKDQKTNIDGIYAAGDLTNGSNLKQTITAASQGAISALSAYNYCLENKN